uniref:Uncharacterized protein n=1 Tax=Amphimedon queenslandica TaxID=400682 RepID=A0A1X7TJM7_AMPQE
MTSIVELKYALKLSFMSIISIYKGFAKSSEGSFSYFNKRIAIGYCDCFTYPGSHECSETRARTAGCDVYDVSLWDFICVHRGVSYLGVYSIYTLPVRSLLRPYRLSLKSGPDRTNGPEKTNLRTERRTRYKLIY